MNVIPCQHISVGREKSVNASATIKMTERLPDSLFSELAFSKIEVFQFGTTSRIASFFTRWVNIIYLRVFSL